MWDTGIRSRYGIPTYSTANHAQHYLRFLKLMQLQFGYAIEDYAEAHCVNTKNAIQQIRRDDDYSFLPRIVDKYNFAIRDGKLRICAECYKRWRRMI